MTIVKKIIAIAVILGLLNIYQPPVFAVTEVATGTNPEICNQTVSSITGVTSQRSGQDCIITFTNTTEITWTVPTGINQVSAIIVGGGGGGGDSTASATGGGGGAGGFFANSNIYVTGDIAIAVGAGGAGSAVSTQGSSGGNSYIGTLKVGGGGGGNGVTYAGGARARTGVGGTDFVSSGSGGGGRPTGTASYTSEYLGGLAGNYASGGINFLGTTYTGLQGAAGIRNSDGASGGMGGSIASADRTSSISGSSVVYAKNSGYWAWESGSNTAGTKTAGSGGSPNYNYGTDPYGSGGAGADGIVIIRYTIASSMTNPTYTGDLVKGTWESVSVNVNIAGNVRFYIDGKRISTCLSVATTGSWPTYTATCNWKPTVQGNRVMTAYVTPSDGTTAGISTSPIKIVVIGRKTKR